MTSREAFDRRHVIEIRDAAYRPLGRLRDWDDLTYVQRFCEVGQGNLDCLASDHNRALLQPGNTLVAKDRNRVVAFGPLEFGENRQGNSISLPVDFSDANLYLDEKQARVDPLVVPNGLLSKQFDERTGPTTSVIMGIVSDNMGPTALYQRRVPGLVMSPDPRSGVLLNAPVQARNDMILPFIRPLAMTGGVSFWFDLVDRALVFRCEQVTNRSARVVFSSRTHSILASSSRVKGPTATKMLVAGDGDGIEQVFVEVQSAEALADEIAWGRRIEGFTTGRSDGESLEAIGLRELADHGATIEAEFTPTDSALQFGRDYFMGDLVSCVLWPGLTVVKPIREVLRTVSVNDGVKVIPTAGDYGASGSSSGGAFTTKQLERVVDSLKRR